MSKKKLSSKQKWSYIFIAPWIIYFLIFLIYPMYMALKNSFLDINLLQPEKAQFVGFQNWINAILDPLFWQSIFNILFNQVIFIALTFIIALALALILNEVKAFSSLFRTIYFIPVITSITVAMLIFNYLSGVNGPIQQFMLKANLMKNPIFWKMDKWLPMPILAVFNSWKWFGTSMIIFIGGLASIDRQVYEAASIDGASWHDTLFKITLPLLKPQIVFVLTMNIINGLQMFTEVFMNFDLTGGTYHSALTPVLYLYDKGFSKMQMGQACSMGLLLAVIIFVLTKLQNKILKVEEG